MMNSSLSRSTGDGFSQRRESPDDSGTLEGSLVLDDDVDGVFPFHESCPAYVLLDRQIYTHRDRYLDIYDVMKKEEGYIGKER